jgi:tetratricopeptide (TPR) repeat protein
MLSSGVVCGGISWLPSPQAKSEALMRESDESISVSDYKKNLAIMKNAAAVDPENPQVWAKLCEAYGLTGEIDSAIKACEHRITLDPTESPYNSLGLTYEEKKDYASAASAFEKATSHSANAAIQWNFVWALLCSKQYEKAVPAGQRLLEISKNIKEGAPVPDPQQNAYEMLGVAYKGIGKTKEAQAAFQNAKVQSCEMGKSEKGDWELRCTGKG